MHTVSTFLMSAQDACISHQSDYHLQKNELIAFGDGENDIEMLQEVGLSVAMGMQLIM